MSKELTELIDKIKADTGLSQQEIAEKLGYDPQYLSQLLNGHKKVSSKTIEKVKRYFPRQTVTPEPEKNYLLQRRQKMLEEKEVWFPVYQGNTRLKEESNLTVYRDEPEEQVPIGFLPQNMYPGCNHGERVFGNSMYPRIANQGYVAGKIIDKTKIVFGELYGLHLTGNNPAVVKYIHPCNDDSRCVLLVSEKRDLIKDQKISIDDVTMIFRVLFIINPA